jgi:predicted GIY-YIG superfamily endonuclease
MITTENFDIKNFSSSFDYLKLNIVTGQKVTFLDLEISINNLTNKLEYSLYINPTNTFSYLRTDSNHPEFIFNNIPKSLMIRIRRICSSYDDFLYHSSLLIIRLINRGYTYKKLVKIRNMVSKLDREKLIPYKDKTTNLSNETIYFKIPYEKNLFDEKSIKHFFKNHKFLIDNSEIPIKLIHNTQPNLASILIHKFKIPKEIRFSNKTCNKKTCEICIYINKNPFIELNNKIQIALQCNNTCDAKYGIYFIKCKLCNVYYIGESKDIKRRIGYHIGTIKNFIPFKKYHDLPVAKHFNLKNHDLKSCFEFSIFKDNIEDDLKRFNMERECIHLIKNLTPIILNLSIPKPPEYPQFLFSK